MYMSGFSSPEICNSNVYFLYKNTYKLTIIIFFTCFQATSFSLMFNYLNIKYSFILSKIVKKEDNFQCRNPVTVHILFCTSCIHCKGDAADMEGVVLCFLLVGVHLSSAHPAC